MKRPASTGRPGTPCSSCRVSSSTRVAGSIESSTYVMYDGAIGTGGMLTVAEQTLAGPRCTRRGKRVSTHLYGQEINAETYAICKADLLLKGEGNSADNIVGGPEHSTLSNDASDIPIQTGRRPSTSC